MNWRKSLYFAAHQAVGSQLPHVYRQYLAQDRTRSHMAIAQDLLGRLLAHSLASVPYYRAIYEQVNSPADQVPGAVRTADPQAILQQLPILTKALIRTRSEDLVASDLTQRSWHYNTSGGSTGEPIRLIQDSEHKSRVVALQMLYSTWVGTEVGDRQVSVWGSEREILLGNVGVRVMLANLLTNRIMLNAFRMSPERMRTYIRVLNNKQPKLIVAYAQSIYELAQFARREGLPVCRQRAIITSAGTLYSFMRETLEQVFGCPIFDRYGSREVGDIAGECHYHQGLHVLPWGSYVEIVDETGMPVPPGVEGRIVVTCLTNYAMPLIRYDIGDRGALAPANTCPCGRRGQLLLRLAGRNVDSFKASNGTIVDGEYFTHLLYFRSWAQKFQVIQEALDVVRFKVMLTDQPCPPEDLATITEMTRTVMGPDCSVNFEFVDDIPQLSSGKYRYTISLVTQGAPCAW